MLKGELRTFGLAEVLQSLAINNHTGTLKITAPGRAQKLIYFENGTITLFSMGGAGPSRIGEVLVRSGKLAPAQLEEALEEQKHTKEILGAILLKKGFVTEKDLRRAVEKKVREELYELFLWKEGSFEFLLDCFPEDQIDEVQRATRISLDVKSVIIEGLRRVDEWALIEKEIRTLDEILVKTGKEYAGQDPLAVHFLGRIDGTQPVRELLEGAPGERFECCKALYELIESGHLRPRTLEELLRLAAESSANGNLARAVTYLKFAAQLDPSDPEIQRKLGEAYSGLYQGELAAKAQLNAFRLYYARGDTRQVLSIARALLRREVAEDDDLEKIFLAFFEAGDLKAASSTAQKLVASLQKKSEFARATAVLKKLSEKCPSDLELKLRIAQSMDSGGEKDAAAAFVENLAAEFRDKKRYAEALRVLKFLAGLDPKRPDLKEKIAETRWLLEKQRRRRRLRIGVGAGATIAVLAVVLVPLLYEIKSLEALRHCQRLEQIDAAGGDYSRSKSAYREFLSRYALSSNRREARTALARIEEAERNRQRALEEKLLRQKLEQEARFQEMNQAILNAKALAAAAEAERDFQKAHEIYAGILKDYAEHPSTKSILLPVLITSSPSGATVKVNGEDLGKAPVVYRYSPGTSATIAVSRVSCEPVTRTVELRDQWELRFKLPRKPVGGIAVAANIFQPMVSAEGMILLLSRDGSLHAVDISEKTAAWQRTVGRFGDRLSNLAAWKDAVYLGTVSAELAAISATTGRSKWISKVTGPVLAAPGISEDGRWVAVGTVRGSAEVFDAEKGGLVARFTTENEILARPVFVGSLLVAGSTDNSLYGYSMEEKGLVFVEDLAADISIDLCRFGNAVAVATADGAVHLFDPSERKLLWTWRDENGGFEVVALTASDSSVLLGTSRGTVLALDGKTGSPVWNLQVGDAAVAGFSRAGSRLYATLESGFLSAIDIGSGKELWNYASEEAFVVPPLAIGDYLFFLGISGRLQYMEVSE